MGDGFYNALEAVQRFMDGNAVPHNLVWFGASAVLASLGTLVHELGHAMVARRHGVTVHELMSEPEGPALVFRRKNLVVRVGMGLGRDLRSRAASGWVLLESPRLETREAIEILRAGPLAQAALGTIELCLAAAPLPLLGRVMLALTGATTTFTAAANLLDRSHPGSDGSQIAWLQQHGVPRSAASPAAYPDDPRASTSVPPPGFH
jgi:membrane-associated protease RseP (regulator of RpoE activity)